MQKSATKKSIQRSLLENSVNHRQKCDSKPFFSTSQRASTAFPEFVGSNQTIPLATLSPSLALISAQDSAGSSGMEPRGTGKIKRKIKRQV